MSAAGEKRSVPESGHAAAQPAAKAARSVAGWRTVQNAGGVYFVRTDPKAEPSRRVAAFDMVRACALLHCTPPAHTLAEWRLLSAG